MATTVVIPTAVKTDVINNNFSILIFMILPLFMSVVIQYQDRDLNVYPDVFWLWIFSLLRLSFLFYL